MGNLFGDQLDVKGKEQLLKKLAVVSQNHLVNIVRLLAMVQNRDEPVRTYIWLIFTRTVTPLEIFRWFPQIVFTLVTSVKPINIGFSNRFFFVDQIKGVQCLLSKKMLKKINLRVRFLALKIVFLGVLKMIIF